jgi:hypothetical protein
MKALTIQEWQQPRAFQPGSADGLHAIGVNQACSQYSAAKMAVST